MGERGGLRTRRPKGVYQACGAIHQECRGEHTQSWDHRGKRCWELRALGQLPPHTPPKQSHTHTHTHTHTQSCTLPWLSPTRVTLTTIQSYSHAKRLHSQTPNLTVLSTKSHEFVFVVEEFQCTHTQDHCTPIISTAHETLTGSPQDHVCMLLAG